MTTSLLSLQMDKVDQAPRRQESTAYRPSSTSVSRRSFADKIPEDGPQGSHSTYQDEDDVDDAATLEDPPVSLNALGEIRPLPSTFHELPTHHHQGRDNFNTYNEKPLYHRHQMMKRDRISPMENVDLTASPLTARSVHVLEREYDEDTWRMYNRIQAARIAGKCRKSQDSDDSDDDDAVGKLEVVSDDASVQSDEVDELQDAIFDLEMETS